MMYDGCSILNTSAALRAAVKNICHQADQRHEAAHAESGPGPSGRQWRMCGMAIGQLENAVGAAEIGIIVSDDDHRLAGCLKLR